MDNPNLKLVDEGGEPPDPGDEVRLVNMDMTPKLMASCALATLAVFIIYGLARIALDPPRSLLTATYAAGAIAAAVYGLCLLRSGSWPWLLAMIAAVGVFTGSCFAVCQSTHNFAFLLIGAGALLAGFLTALLRNIDERVSFMPMVVSLLVSSSLILFCLS